MVREQGRSGEPEELDLQWDTEQPHELAGEVVARIRLGACYVPAAFVAFMKEAWGSLPPAVVTSTNADTQTVFIGKAPAKHPGAVRLRVADTFGTAEFSFFRPLRKLNLEIPENRQLEVDVQTATAKGGATVFKLEMNQARNKPRNIAEEEAGQNSNQTQTMNTQKRRGKRKGQGQGQDDEQKSTAQTAAGAQPLPESETKD